MSNHPIAHHNLDGNIPWTEAFRPVNSNRTITDKHGEIWKQVTALGWYRQSDKFFWPGDPTNCNNMQGCSAPTVEQVELERSLPLK